MSRTTKLTAEQQSLVVQHLALATYFAAPFLRARPRHREEISSAAALGLVIAARNFDPARGHAFSTHARPTIVGYIRMALAKERTHGFSDTGIMHDPTRPTPFTRLPASHLDHLAAAYDYSTWGLSDAPTLPPHEQRRLRVRELRASGHTHSQIASLLRTTTHIVEGDLNRTGPQTRPRRNEFPPGVRRVKGRNAFQARAWLAAEGRSQSLGVFHVYTHGSERAAVAAAAYAHLEFERFYDPGQPGHDLAATLEHLKLHGLIPVNPRFAGRPRRKAAA